MYNRYVRNEDGMYQRVSAGEAESTGFSPSSACGKSTGASIDGFFSQIMEKLKLDDLDTGDLLLLAILFLLFRDGEDEELLLALGLLLIL